MKDPRVCRDVLLVSSSIDYRSMTQQLCLSWEGAFKLCGSRFSFVGRLRSDWGRNGAGHLWWRRVLHIPSCPCPDFK